MSTSVYWNEVKGEHTYIWHDGCTNTYFTFHRINWQWHLILLTGDRCSDLWNCLAVAVGTDILLKGQYKITSLESQMTWKGFRRTIFAWSSGYFTITGSGQFTALYYFLSNTWTLIFCKEIIGLCEFKVWLSNCL